MPTYKISKGTKTFNALIQLMDKIKTCNKLAEDLAIELGGKNTASTGRYLAGGIEAVEFDSNSMPDKAIWKSVGYKWQNLYKPKSSQKAIWDKIIALPTMNVDELNNIINFESQFISSDRGMADVKRPAVIICKKYILMELPNECKYKPNEDIIEILNSEYVNLLNKIKNWDEQL